MKKLFCGLTLTVAALGCSFANANPADSCDGEQVIFTGYTVKGHKYLQLCYVSGDVRYVYGIDGKKPELVFNTPIEKAEFFLTAHGDSTVVLPRGAYRYTVSDLARGKPILVVDKGNKNLATIEISFDNLESNISDYIQH